MTVDLQEYLTKPTPCSCGNCHRSHSGCILCRVQWCLHNAEWEPWHFPDSHNGSMLPDESFSLLPSWRAWVFQDINERLHYGCHDNYLTPTITSTAVVQCSLEVEFFPFQNLNNFNPWSSSITMQSRFKELLMSFF